MGLAAILGPSRGNMALVELEQQRMKRSVQLWLRHMNSDDRKTVEARQSMKAEISHRGEGKGREIVNEWETPLSICTDGKSWRVVIVEALYRTGRVAFVVGFFRELLGCVVQRHRRRAGGPPVRCPESRHGPPAAYRQLKGVIPGQGWCLVRLALWSWPIIFPPFGLTMVSAFETQKG